jgi:3'-5' exoribonuclease
MMGNRRFINELKAGETLDQVFLVIDKELRTTRTGDLYITCKLGDESFFQSIPTDGFLQVKGRTEDYRGMLQLIIDACRPFPAEQVRLDDFVSVTERDVEQMWAELTEILRGVRNRPLRMLIKKFVEDAEFVAAFQGAPAAMQMHHPFVGGLLEHTLNVARAAQMLLPMYPKLNADLVLAGVFLHDIGKTAELHAGTSLGYTDRGQLIGHITIAAIWVAERAAAVAEQTGQPFPQRTLDLLQHIILSHHGVHDYGSPKLPMIPEAYMIHYLDNLDAKMFMTVHDIENDLDATSAWTPYNRQLETRLFKHSHKLGD